MNPKLAHLLTALYPRRWKERYGVEFEALLHNGRGDLRATANVIWSALGEHISPTPGLESQDQGTIRRWCARAPWAMFGIAPVLVLIAAYFLAALYLWSGWTIFLPGAETPFGTRHPGNWIANLYFQAGKFYYFGAPVLVGWGIGLVAIRQRVKMLWPMVGFTLLSMLGSIANIQASRNSVPNGLGHIRMDFGFRSSFLGASDTQVHALAILFLIGMPLLISISRRSTTALS